MRTGVLGDAHGLYDLPEADFSPFNLWPADRSWVLRTDNDLWATEFAGPVSLARALLADAVIDGRTAPPGLRGPASLQGAGAPPTLRP